MKFYSIIKYQSGKMMQRDVYKGGIAMRYDAFHPGQVWLDTEGKRIQAHGGSVMYLKGT